MENRQIKLNVPEWVYRELDKLSKHKVEGFLRNFLQKTISRPQKSSVDKIFDIFGSKRSFSLEHDKYLYK